MKKLTIALTATLVGCAGALGYVVPQVEAAAGANGVRLEVGNVSAEVKTLCLEEGGKVDSLLGKVPVVGNTVRELIGVCPVSTEVQ